MPGKQAPALGFLLAISASVALGAAPLRLDRPLLAWWTFDEPGGARCADASGNGHAASAAGRHRLGIARGDGVFGNALRLSGAHRLEVGDTFSARGLSELSFSAWTRPTELGAYREIFRKEDGDRRLLFSFQLDGTILSLGLNARGYLECDAPIDPRVLLDGAWHHCAATYDGRFMRVYLDGREIGSLERPGPLSAEGGARGCIGSLEGGEPFQGMIDDLRISSVALTAGEIAALHGDGARELAARPAPNAAAAPEAERRRRAEEALDSLYARSRSFAETLARTREAFATPGRPALDGELAQAVMRRLATDFPEDCARFWPGADPLDYLAAGDESFQVAEAERLVELLLEYLPLTEEQKRRISPEEARRWEEAVAIRDRLERLRARGAAAFHSSEWIELLMEAGRRIHERPVVHEAVAPYVRPATPPLRALSAAEAREALRRDWLHQADGSPTPERIRDEIRWTRELARRIAEGGPEPAGLALDLAADLAALDSIERAAASIAAPDAQLYFRLRELKRAIMFRNPRIDFDKVLFIDAPYPQGSEWQHETRHRLGYMAVPGGRLLVLEGLSPGGAVVQLMPRAPLHGSFWRPDLSYDATRVLVSFKPHNEKSFHLYEVDAGGAAIVQLTDGPYDDLDPIYLPDGHILFSTTRGHTYVRCMPPTNAYVLARCDRDGKNIYLTSQNNEPDYLPSVMDDGRVIYTRWEYTDKPLWRAQKLWTVNPDGTQVMMFWGNQSVWPDLLKDARPIPGSHRVMVTGSAHHNWFSGSVGIIDAARGLNFPHGLTKVTADVPWPECGNGPVDPIESPSYHASGRYPAYCSPYPFGEQDFLVSAQRGSKFLLYLMDVDGNRELIYEGAHNVLHAIPFRPRPQPPVLVDRVEWPSREDRLRPATGTLFSANVYEGVPGDLKGKARLLRVLHIEPKTYTYWYKRPYISTGPVVSAVQSEGVKRILGTVPIEADGSVSFRAPAGMALHFQLLDERGRALQTMRSFAGVMPGERRGCLGCHELHSRTPAAAGGGLAFRREPSDIAPPPWKDDTVSFARYVQPALDRHCGRCHQGGGEARRVLDLTSRPAFDLFTEPYLTLIGRPTWGEPYRRPPDAGPGFGVANMIMVEGFGTLDPIAYRTPKPMTFLSYRSRLVEIASSGEHHGVVVDPVDLARLIVWVDAMCPNLGDDEIRAIPDPVFQGMEWLAIRPRIQTAPRIVRPGPVD